MSIKPLQIGLLGSFLCAATWAGASPLQGVVTDPAGQPVKGAEVRVEPRNGGNALATAKSDANGRYATASLPAGTYRVTLLVNGAVRASINNTKTLANRPTALNFQLQALAGGKRTAKGGKHRIWVPSDTGSHLSGRWVEVDDSGAATAGASNSQTVNKAELQRQVLSSGSGHETTGGTNSFGR